jgi:aerobic carbon-monoxide dehydrogenase small subunit
VSKLSEHLRRRREDRKLTQAELASLAGVSQGAISQYELGTITPRARRLVTLARALELPEEELFELAGYGGPEGAAPAGQGGAPPGQSVEGADERLVRSLAKALADFVRDRLGNIFDHRRVAEVFQEELLEGSRPVGATTDAPEEARTLELAPELKEHAKTRATPGSTTVAMFVNGQIRSAKVEPRLLLVHFLRDNLGLTGTHIGCDTSHCGACTVLLDGTPVKSCTMFAIQANGREVTTVEGLAVGGKLHPIQEGFKREHGLQCGFCTPGMLLASKALLEENPDPSEEEIRWALSGNLCRCIGYQNIVDSVRWAAKTLRAIETPRTPR